MKTKSIEYNAPETKEECFSTSCVFCYWFITDRSKCEEFYREKMNAGIAGSEIPLRG